MAHIHSRLDWLLPPAVALATVALATACGGNAPLRTKAASHRITAPVVPSAGSSTPAPGNAQTARPLDGPISATFISPSTGWLLALRVCHHPHCSWLRMRKTTDHGRHWSAVPAPPAPYEWQSRHIARRSVSQVRFADAADGWAFGPGLWATHDGGASWHQASMHGLYVQDLEAAGGRVLAVLSRCAPLGGRCTGVQVYTSPVAADAWQAIPGTGGVYRSASVVVSGNFGYVTDVPDPLANGAVAVQAGPADGSAPWSPLPAPCRYPYGPFGAWLAAAPGGTLVIACANQPSAGQQLKRAYLSADGGQRWRRLDDPSPLGYLGGISITPAGTIFVSGLRSDVWASRNHGRSWHDVLTDSSGAADGFDAAMTTSTQGFALPQDSSPRGIIWFTYDDGRTWRPVTVR